MLRQHIYNLLLPKYLWRDSRDAPLHMCNHSQQLETHNLVQLVLVKPLLPLPRV
jgi:hypothetical protein